MTFWNGVLWLHLLAMAFFVGGQLMLAAVLVPALRGVDGGQPLWRSCGLGLSSPANLRGAWV